MARRSMRVGIVGAGVMAEAIIGRTSAGERISAPMMPPLNCGIRRVISLSACMARTAPSIVNANHASSCAMNTPGRNVITACGAVPLSWRWPVQTTSATRPCAARMSA